MCMYLCRVHKSTPPTCIQIRTPPHSRDCSSVDLICKQIIKLIAHCISIEPPNPYGFVPLICCCNCLIPKTNVQVGNDSESHMNGSEIPSHLVSGTERLQLELEAPPGKSIRSSPCLCSISLPSLFLITSPKPQSLVWLWQFSFGVHSLLTLNISLRVFGRLWGQGETSESDRDVIAFSIFRKTLGI